MNLFINAVSQAWALILFDDNRDIIRQLDITIRWNESSKLITLLDEFLAGHHLTYNDIEHIVVVHGPGSFTGVRTICLMVNTIAFSTGCSLSDLSYFDLFSATPILKQSSKRDMFLLPIQHDIWEQQVQILSNEDIQDYFLQNNISRVYGEAPAWWEGETIEKIEYWDIIRDISFDNLYQVDPLYIKKPNIC